MKFGGSSVANGSQIRKVHQIVAAAREEPLVVVSSAHKGITNLLVETAARAAAGTPAPDTVIEQQRRVVRELGLDPAFLEPLFTELADLVRGVALVGEASPRVLDHVLSFGERMSVRTLAAFFSESGVRAVPVDAWDVGFVTDARFGRARPLPGWEARMQAAFRRFDLDHEVPVVTGFVGKTEGGTITTVGRNGSDYTASCFAAGLGARECQIWTDTDGVMTADPGVVKEARNIPRMSFEEAAELARFGGRVLHPSTLLPAVENNIPVRVLNTNRPAHPGTVITQAEATPRSGVTSIAYKESQVVLTIETAQMLGQSGFLARVFDTVGRHGVDIDVVSTSEVSISMTATPNPSVEAAAAALAELGKVRIEKGRSVVCVVGPDLKHLPGFAAEVFGALRETSTNVEIISHGANNINLSLVVADEQIAETVLALHARLIASRPAEPGPSPHEQADR